MPIEPSAPPYSSRHCIVEMDAIEDTSQPSCRETAPRYKPLIGASRKEQNYQRQLARFATRCASGRYAAPEDFQKGFQFASEVVQHKHPLSELQEKCQELAQQLFDSLSEEAANELFEQQEYKTQAEAESSAHICSSERTWYWPICCKKPEERPVMWRGSTRRNWESLYRLFETVHLKMQIKERIEEMKSQQNPRQRDSHQRAEKWGLPYPEAEWGDCLRPDNISLGLMALGGAICVVTPIIWAISCVRVYCPEGYHEYTESYRGTCYDSDGDPYSCTKYDQVCENKYGGRANHKTTWRDAERCRPKVLAWPETAGGALIALGILIPTVQTIYKKTANAFVNGTECCLTNLGALGRWVHKKLCPRFDTNYTELDALIDDYNGLADKNLTVEDLDKKYRRITASVDNRCHGLWKQMLSHCTTVLQDTESK